MVFVALLYSIVEFLEAVLVVNATVLYLIGLRRSGRAVSEDQRAESDLVSTNQARRAGRAEN